MSGSHASTDNNRVWVRSCCCCHQHESTVAPPKVHHPVCHNTPCCLRLQQHSSTKSFMLRQGACTHSAVQCLPGRLCSAALKYQLLTHQHLARLIQHKVNDAALQLQGIPDTPLPAHRGGGAQQAVCVCVCAHARETLPSTACVSTPSPQQHSCPDTRSWTREHWVLLLLLSLVLCVRLVAQTVCDGTTAQQQSWHARFEGCACRQMAVTLSSRLPTPHRANATQYHFSHRSDHF